MAARHVGAASAAPHRRKRRLFAYVSMTLGSVNALHHASVQVVLDDAPRKP